MVRWLTALLCLVVLAVTAAAGLLAWFDGERVRQLLHKELSSEHGVILTIDSLKRSYSLRPQVRLRGLTVASAMDPSETLIRIEEARFKLRAFSLLVGPVTLDQVDVDGISFTVPVDDDGVMYWEPVVDAVSDWLHRLDWSLTEFEVRDLVLERRHRGRGNELLISARHVAGAMPRLEELRLRVRDVEADLETALPLQLKGTARIDKVALDRSDGGLPMGLTATGRVEQEPLRIRLEGGNLLAGDPLDRMPVRGSVELGNTLVSLDGTMSRDDDTHLDLHVTIDSPGDDGVPGLRGRLELSDPSRGWRFSAIRLTRGEAVVTGDIGLEERDGRRRLFADLQAGNVNYPQSHNSGGRSDEDERSILPEGDPIANLFDFVNTFDAIVKFTAAESSLYGVPFKRLVARVTTHNGFVDLTVDEATVLDGNVQAVFKASPGQGETTLDFEAKVAGADLAALTSRLSALEGISGTFDGDFALHATGRETDAVLSSLEGRTVFELRHGSMPEELATWLAGDIFSALFTDFDREDVTPIDCALVDLPVRKGQAIAQTLVLDTGSFAIVGNGEIDFSKRKLHFELVPSSKEFSLLSMRLPLRIRGPFGDIEIDANRSEAIISLLSPISSGDAPGVNCGPRPPTPDRQGTN